MKRSWMFCSVLGLVLVLGAACAAEPHGHPAGDDDPDRPDAEPSSVVEVDCAAAPPAATVTTSGFSYSPDAVTIGAGEVVRFVVSASHDAASTDGLFRVGFGGDACLRFDEPGSYGFVCTPHGFSGVVTVR
jgi:plastocyanin